MNAHLFIIIAIVITSILTLSQRLSAQEISKYRWAPSSIKQQLSESNATRRATLKDCKLLVAPLMGLASIPFYSRRVTSHDDHIESIFDLKAQPRAPPVFIS